MIKKNKLIDARNKRGYSQDYLAGALDINVSNYSRKETGKINISHNEWKILAEKLEIPMEDIYESDESIFIFNDNSTGNGNIVTNYTIPQSIWETQKKYIERLEDENRNLKDEIGLLKEHLKS